LLRILLVARSNWSKMARLWTWMIIQIAIMPVTSMEMSINRIIWTLIRPTVLTIIIIIIIIILIHHRYQIEIIIVE
jgi:hypothetical protein